MLRGFQKRLFSMGVLVALHVAVRAFSQSVPPPQPSTEGLVLVRVTVASNFNKPLNVKLNQENFRIFEDRRPQEIQFFSNDDVPVSFGILLDVSGSMGEHHKLEASHHAIIEFLRASNPADEAFLLTFAESPEMMFGLTPLKDIWEIPRPEAKKRTALLDAINLGLDKIEPAHNSHKALIIFSDGGDNASRYTEAQIKNRLKRTDTELYVIGMLSLPNLGKEASGPPMLGEIADMTGGLAARV